MLEIQRVLLEDWMTQVSETTPKQGTWEEAVLWLRQQPDQQDLVRDAFYDDPLDAAAERYFQGNEWQAVRAVLAGRSGNALDIGAGRGIASYALAKDGFAVTALEPDPSDIVGGGAIRALAEQHNLNIKVTETTSEVLPFPDNSFDVVYGRAVLHHIDGLADAMKEFYRVLKPGGLFIGLREHVISKPEDLQQFLKIHPLHHLYGGENAHSVDFYKKTILNSGLELQTVFGPLENAMNYAPHDRNSMLREIAEKFSAVPVLPKLVYGTLKIPVLGNVLLKAAARIDHRPGRHYSFVAVRPQ